MRELTLRLALACGALTMSFQFGHAAGNRVLPFWAQPYPYGYAYTTRLPQPDPCFKWTTVDTLFGPRRERAWICGDVVTSRY